MKTLKLISVVILLTIALVNTANADGAKANSSKNIIKLTYMEAIQSTGLVNAMYKQLSGGYLGGPGIYYLTLRVTYQNHVYMITGTIDQWDNFFSHRGFRTKSNHQSQ